MSFKKVAMEQAMKLMSSPTVGKMMQNPKVMQAMMTAMSLPGKVQAQLDQQRRNIARALNLVTQEEVEGLKSTIRDLNSQVGSLQREADAAKRGNGR
jgi:polyhydroxyalkanoate synthesis regulator phasin